MLLHEQLTCSSFSCLILTQPLPLRPMQLWLGAIGLACNMATARCISSALGRAEAPMSPGADALLGVSFPSDTLALLVMSWLTACPSSPSEVLGAICSGRSHCVMVPCSGARALRGTSFLACRSPGQVLQPMQAPAMAWHPHKQLLAAAGSSTGVYVALLPSPVQGGSSLTQSASPDMCLKHRLQRKVRLWSCRWTKIE